MEFAVIKMFIHCLFVGFEKEFKGKGYASSLIDECIEDAKNNKMLGVAVVTREGSFMADNAIFVKKGFQVVDNAKPDFNLLVLKFDAKSKKSEFHSKHRREFGKIQQRANNFAFCSMSLYRKKC